MRNTKMIDTTTRPCSVFCILPPKILNSIVLRGSDRQRKRALRVLALSQSFQNARLGQSESQRTIRLARRARLQSAQKAWWQAATGGNKQRTIFTAHNTERIPGNRVRAEGDPPTGDAAVDEAYDYMGNTFDFYLNVFGRNSIDNDGMPLNGTVHYSQDYANAYWDGRRMVYGDGDNDEFLRFTKSIDVIGHELTHGVIEFESGLIYWNQPGALNESLADVFGSLVKQFTRNQTADQADWIIGEGLFTPRVEGVGIRSLAAPGTAFDDDVLGKDDQPAHMRNYVRGLADSGGVHTNSGIPNHAFYLAAKKIGGYAWKGAGLIWYKTLQSPMLRKTANFSNFARLTVMTAQQLFPGGIEPKAVRESWAEVGVVV